MSSDEKVPPQQKSSWVSFIKSIATFKGDLASLTAPPFLLSPQSMVEFSTYWAENPSVFVAPAAEPDPEKRALLVLKWFLSTLKQQHNNRDENGKKKKMKPLNPFLGELFFGQWEDAAGTTNLVAEQVSHHPPATACNIWNDQHGIRLQGNVAPKIYFSGTVHIDRKGYSLLHIDKYDEDYLITMPKIHIEGLMTGGISPELSGSSYIYSSSGYTSKIDYTSKGWLGGKRNSFNAIVYKESEQAPIYKAEGQWSDEFSITEVSTGKEAVRFNSSTVKRTPLTIAPVEKQHPMESRRAWQHVVDAINANDIFAVGQHKSKIENEQRELRKIEKLEGRDYQRRYFTKVKEDKVAQKLSNGTIGVDVDHGIWLWDEEKYRRIEEAKMNRMKSPTRIRFDSVVEGMIEDETASEIVDA